MVFDASGDVGKILTADLARSRSSRRSSDVPPMQDLLRKRGISAIQVAAKGNRKDEPAPH